MTNERNHIDKVIALLKSCFERGVPFYAYRLPAQKSYVIGVATTTKPIANYTLQDLSGKEGFLIHPFVVGSDKTDIPLFIQGDFTTKDSTLDELLEQVEASPYTHSCSTRLGGVWSQESYLDTIASLVGQLQGDELEKVVIARTKIIETQGYEIAPTLFTTLMDNYPNAYVFLCYVPSRMAWLGASPELLLKRTNKGYTTMSLAATRPNKLPISWNKKELEEQQIVTDYMQHIFEQFSITDVVQKPLHTHVAGNLAHLCSIFEGKTVLDDASTSQLLSALHPTPAVGGVPKERAIDLILTSECAPRRYYAGYLGEHAANGELALYVNLRSMEITPTAIQLYAGGGITALSNPIEEWEETELKFKTLMQYIEK